MNPASTSASSPPASTPAATPALVVAGLRAGYDGVEVVHDVSFEVAAGEVVALLGANGAGKTTTLLAISGLAQRFGGTIDVLGERVVDRRRPTVAAVWKLARTGVAHVPEDRGLFFDLTASENLRLGRPRGRARAQCVSDEELFSWFPALPRVLDRNAGLLSGGEQQMLAIARAVVSRPRLLLIDEMSLGLAPIIVEQLLPVLRTIAQETGAGIVLVEQHVGLVLTIADQAVLLRQGAVVFAGTAAQLEAQPELLEAGYLGDDQP